MEPKIAYRPDIDGLRAIAVGGVVLFHYAPDKFPRGFLGVDVFLVISGFLIPRILEKERRSGTFSLQNFYRRRIKRLLPMAILVVLTTVITCQYLASKQSKIAYLSEYRLREHKNNVAVASKKFCRNLAIENENINILQTHDILASTDGVLVMKDGFTLYWNHDHISVEGSRLFVPQIKQHIENLIR